MREEHGQLAGDVVIYEAYTLWGSVGGNVNVIKGGKFYLRGAIYGNLTVEPGGRVHVFGNVAGDLVVMEKAKVIVSGMIGGDAINEGGRLFIDTTAKIMGRVKTKRGETKVQSPYGTPARAED
jgi:cytoskeletal protein CcmA (bactofilin family)